MSSGKCQTGKHVSQATFGLAPVEVRRGLAGGSAATGGARAGAATNSRGGPRSEGGARTEVLCSAARAAPSCAKSGTESIIAIRNQRRQRRQPRILELHRFRGKPGEPRTVGGGSRRVGGGSGRCGVLLVGSKTHVLLLVLPAISNADYTSHLQSLCWFPW